MSKLTKKKRKWIIQQFRAGRSASSIDKMEKWFDTMKKRFKKHPNESLQDFVKWYNEKRIHYALVYDTPEKVYWEKVWTNFRIENRFPNYTFYRLKIKIQCEK